jgi:hypothetical protein
MFKALLPAFRCHSGESNGKNVAATKNGACAPDQTTMGVLDRFGFVSDLFAV